MDESLRLRGRRLSLLKLMRKEKTSDITHRPRRSEPLQL
jgi:hypothetical protein